MSWNQIYRDMAFTPDKDDFARGAELKDALTTLYCYMQGRAREYEVQDALALLEARHGAGVTMACNAIRKALKLDDEIARDQLCLESIGLIERFLLRNSHRRGI